MPSLRATLDSLAHSFAQDVLSAIRSANLQELLAGADSSGGRRRTRGTRSAGLRAGGGGGGQPDPLKTRRRRGRLARRSAADIAKVLTGVVAHLKKHKDGLRSEQIQKALGLDKREIPRVLRDGLAKKALRSKGEKRARTYFAR